MGVFILKRLFTIVPVLLVVSFLTFMLGNFSAGDAARKAAEKEYVHPTVAQIEFTRTKMGLDRPVLVRYFDWLSDALTGELGTSYTSGKPIAEEIAVLFPKTLLLSSWALLFLTVSSFSMGILSAVFQGKWMDRLIQAYCFVSASVPEFLAALLLLYYFGTRLRMVSVLGGSAMKQPLLPAVSMVLCLTGGYARLVKTNMEEVLNSSYIRAARARGVGEWKIVCCHALKNAMQPVLNKLGMGFGAMLAGSAVIESIFSWNGLGKYALEAVKAKDFPAIQGFVLFVTVFIVFINLLVDIVCKILDPRVTSV